MIDFIKSVLIDASRNKKSFVDSVFFPSCLPTFFRLEVVAIDSNNFGTNLFWWGARMRPAAFVVFFWTVVFLFSSLPLRALDWLKVAFSRLLIFFSFSFLPCCWCCCWSPENGLIDFFRCEDVGINRSSVWCAKATRCWFELLHIGPKKEKSSAWEDKNGICSTTQEWKPFFLTLNNIYNRARKPQCNVPFCWIFDVENFKEEGDEIPLFSISARTQGVGYLP